jgi:cytochrome oxidase assembly protein ShyY1
MTRLRQALVITLGIALAAPMIALGFWQLRVYETQGSEAAQARASAPPVPLSSVARPGAAVTDGYGRPVSVKGTYDPALQLLVPGGSGQFRVLSGLRQGDGSVVAVVRGVTSVPHAPAPPSGVVDQVGVLLPTEEHLPGTDLPSGQIASVRLPALAQAWPGPLIGAYVNLSSADAASQGLTAAAVQLPEAPGRLRNAAYSMQWWLFAAFTLFMAFRIARDIGLRETEVAEITPEPPVEPT